MPRTVSHWLMASLLACSALSADECVEVPAGNYRVQVEIVLDSANDISAKEDPTNMFRHNKRAPE